MIYEIAGLRVLLQNEYDYTTKFCREYLAADQFSPANVTATVTKEEFDEEKNASPQFSDGYIENICLYRSLCRQLPEFDRMLLHCSVLELDGNGYAFLGRSGTGKSTHTKLWLNAFPAARVVNGDKPILQYEKEGFIVHGTPWQGKERWGCNTSAPLRGLCFLEQAKENSIKKLSPTEVSSRLFMQILLPQEENAVEKTLELADKLISSTPAYLLRCNISKEAVKTSYEALRGNPYPEN